MKNPVFLPGETVRIRSTDVHVKFGRFVAFLTTSRIILVDADDDLVPEKELSLAHVAGTEPGKNQDGEPVICIFSRVAQGDIRRLIMTFSRSTGTVRTGERDVWITEISRYSSQARQAPARPAIPFQKPEVRPPDDTKQPVLLQSIVRGPARGPDPAVGEKTGTVPEVIIFPDVRGVPVPVRLENIPGGQRDTQKPAANATGLAQPVQVPGTGVKNTGPNAPDPACPYSKRSFFFCMACGNRVPSGARYCNRCGASVIPPNEDVVQSPWDFLHQAGGSMDLASRWGVSVAPAPGTAAPVSPQESPENRRVPSAQPSIDPAGSASFPRPVGVSAPGSGFPLRQAALVAAIIVFAGVMIAAMGGVLSTGMIGSATPVDNNSGNLVSSGDAGSARPSDAGDNSETTGIGEDTGFPASDSGSTGSSGSDVSSTTADTSIPLTGTYVRVTSSGAWEGTYGAVPAVWAVKGSGDMVYKVDDTGDSGSVSAVFTKDDTTSDDLLIQLYKDGELVKSGNTATPAGSVTLVAGA